MQAQLLPSRPAQAQQQRHAPASARARQQLRIAHLLQQQRAQTQQQLLLRLLEGFQGPVLRTALLRRLQVRAAAASCGS